jgi:hypothetical protein
MGAMKAYYMDLEDLHDNAQDGLEAMSDWVKEAGWVSPTEKEARNARAATAMQRIEDPAVRAIVSNILATAGVDISPVDLPVRSIVPVTLVLSKSA